MSQLQTIAAHVDYIREMLRQTSDDNNYPDELIYKSLLDARASLIYRQISKQKPVSSTNYQIFCLPLEEGQYHDCECVPGDDCLVLKSTIELPKTMRGTTVELLKVMTLDGYKTFTKKRPYIAKFDKYKNTRKDEPFYDIVNDRLVLIGYPDNCLKVVLIQAVLYDPTDASSQEICEAQGEPTSCYSPETDPFPIDAHLISPMYQLVFQQFGFALKQLEDDTNDASQDNAQRS